MYTHLMPFKFDVLLNSDDMARQVNILLDTTEFENGLFLHQYPANGLMPPCFSCSIFHV